MEVNTVLTQLIKNETCFPALKLAWDCQLDVEEYGNLPKITPSHYMKENLMTTEQRNALLCKQQRKISCRKSGFDVMVEPTMVVFQNYKYGDTINVPISIRNISTTSQKATLLMDETFVFKFDESSQRVAKFPPGMTMTATVSFRPEDDRDYYHKMVITTNTTRFAIPIIGIGGRGILNAPDSIVYENVPVKYLETKNTPVCNLGTKTAKFSLSTTGPFSVKPEKGIVPPRETFSMDVSYYSEFVGCHDGYLLIKYESGEEVYVYLRAESVNSNVTLSPPDAQCEDTYLGMKTKFLCSIENKTEFLLDFKWKKGPITNSVSNTPVDTDLDLHGGGDTLDRAIDFLHSCVDDQSICAMNAVGLEDKVMRNYPDDLFTHENFLLEPMVGKVQPHSCTDVYIVFSPHEPITYNSTAYLEITGKEDRMPLALSGNGMGPKFRFGFEVMDLGTIFLGGGHSYEIPVLNVSEIKGKLEFHSIVEKSPLGIPMTVEPLSLSLLPNEHGAFYLSFKCTGKPGEFQEELKFFIPKTKEYVHVAVKGIVTFPGVHFNGKEACVGQVSYGFPKTHTIAITNDSLNYVDVCIKLDEDGKDPPIDVNKILQSFKEENFEFDQDPAEFTIEPSTFSLHPRGVQNITLTVCANQVREVKRKLVCYIAGKDGWPFAWLPVSFSCVVPILKCESPEVYLAECYAQFPYETEFLVRNTTDLSACYCIVPQYSASIRIQSDHLVGVAGPRQVTSIPFKMICTAVGESVAYFDLYTVGLDKKLFTYCLKVSCIPPKLEPTTRDLNFGDIDVLSSFSQSVEIVNSSPLTIPYVATLKEGGENGDKWEINPESGVIKPQSTVSIGITVTLQEVGPHTALLHIGMTETLAFIDVKLEANGIGSSLTFAPKLNKMDTIDFGALFLKSEKTFEYEITNLGHLPKVLEWRHWKENSPENPPRKDSGKPTAGSQNANSKKQPRVSNPNVTLKKSTFTISPAKKIVQPQTAMTVAFSASCNHTRISEDEFILWAYTPAKVPETTNAKSGNYPVSRKTVESVIEPYQDSLKPAIAREIKLKAVFETPTLSFSKKSIVFRIDATPNQDSFERREIVKVENLGSLPVNIKFKTQFPFQILPSSKDEGVDEWSHAFQSHESISLTVSFDGKHLKKEQGGGFADSKLEAVYVGHSGSEFVTLRGEVYFPTLGLEQNVVDFGTIYNGTEAVQEFSVTNDGTFCLTYKWYIKPNSTEIKQGKVYEHSQNEKHDTIPLDLQKSLEKVTAGNNQDYALLTSEFNFFKEDYEVDESQLDEGSGLSNAHLMPLALVKTPSSEIYTQSSAGKSLDEYGDSVQFLREKIYRTRLMEMVGLHDSYLEAEDEMNYLSYNRDKSKASSSVSINELIDIIPMSGIIPAGTTQTFTIVFYGHQDITFRTKAFCYIEGGTGTSIEIKGASTHASVVVMPKSIDLGTIFSTESVTKKVTVRNIGKVATDVKLCQSSGKQSEIQHYVGNLDISPALASIPAGGSATFKISYVTQVVGKFHSAVFVKAQFCGTIKIEIRGKAIEKKTPSKLIQSTPSKIPVPVPARNSLPISDDYQEVNEEDTVKRASVKDPTKPKRRCKPKVKPVEIEAPIEEEKPKKQKKVRKSKTEKKPTKDSTCILGIEFIDKKGNKYCELPSISNSPDVIFSKIIDAVEEDETVDRVYIRDQDCFDFGPTLVPITNINKVSGTPPDGQTHAHKIKHEENVATFLVKNTSHIPAVCTVSLLHDRFKYFEFQPPTFTVQPGKEQKVTLWAFPKVPYDLLEDHLVFCVKDNPDALFFRIRVMGTQPKIVMEEDILDFGRCLLNSRSVAQVAVTNAGLIPIVWEISEDTPLPEQVFAEKTNGTLKPKEAAEIRFLFKASRPTLINEQTVDIVFKDTQGILGVIDVFKIAMFGEAYDVLVDIASEKENFTLIDFGVLPIGYPIIENLIITNRGNYEILFKFIIEPKKLSPKQKKRMLKYLKDCFLIQPMEDVLGPSEACIVQVVFEPPCELDFVNEQILKCQIVDLNMNVLVAELSIPVSVKAEDNMGSSGDDKK